MHSRVSGFWPGVLLLGWAAGVFAVADDLFDRVEMLSESGATQLALNILETEQPSVDDIDAWQRAERLRIGIYAGQGDWDALAARLDRIPAELPLIHQHRLLTHAVELMLQSGEGGRSRKYLRELIWRSSGDSTQIAHWRRLVIRGYLQEGLLEDARTAMSRYQREYAPTDQDWSYLYGLTLLKSGAFEQAAARLSLVQFDRARALMWLARLRGGTDDPLTVIEQADALYAKIKEADDQPIAMQRLWALQAEAGEAAGDAQLRVKALEKLFSRVLKEDAELSQKFTPGDLWQAYDLLGAEIGNRDNLLVGDTEAWLMRAAELKTRNKYDARAIYAFLAMRASDSEQRDRLHGNFYDLLRDVDLELVGLSVYTDPGRFPEIEDIPPSVRHRIVRYAVQTRNLGLAAEMARDLTAPLAGQSPDEWNLIRARLAIYSGDLASGQALLDDLIRARTLLPDDLADRILQLVFDLQNVDQHDRALMLFRLIQERAQSAKIRREIFFWIGESLKAKGEYDNAAEYYIKSASYGGNHGDVWGRSARYHAAEALAEAGMVQDARDIYTDLQQEVTDPGQFMSLERKLQELWLRNQQPVSN